MNDKEKLISLLILADPNPYICESESKDNSKGGWYDARAVFHWWMQDGVLPGQIEMEDILND